MILLKRPMSNTKQTSNLLKLEKVAMNTEKKLEVKMSNFYPDMSVMSVMVRMMLENHSVQSVLIAVGAE